MQFFHNLNVHLLTSPKMSVHALTSDPRGHQSVGDAISLLNSRNVIKSNPKAGLRVCKRFHVDGMCLLLLQRQHSALRRHNIQNHRSVSFFFFFPPSHSFIPCPVNLLAVFFILRFISPFLSPLHFKRG